MRFEGGQRNEVIFHDEKCFRNSEGSNLEPPSPSFRRLSSAAAPKPIKEFMPCPLNSADIFSNTRVGNKARAMTHLGHAFESRWSEAIAKHYKCNSGSFTLQKSPYEKIRLGPTTHFTGLPVYLRLIDCKFFCSVPCLWSD